MEGHDRFRMGHPAAHHLYVSISKSISSTPPAPESVSTGACCRMTSRFGSGTIKNHNGMSGALHSPKPFLDNQGPGTRWGVPSTHTIIPHLLASTTRRRLTCFSFQTKSLPVDSSNTWLALTVQAHPLTASNAIDGYSIVLTLEDDKIEMETSISVPEESAEPEQATHTTIEGKVKGAGQERRRGLQYFACFQYFNTLVAY